MGQWRAADQISVASRHLLANSKFAGDDVFTKWSPAQTVGIRLWTKFCDFESVGPDCVQHVGYFNPPLFRLSIVTIRYIGRQDVSAVFRTGTSNKKGDDSWSTCDYLKGVHEICCQLSSEMKSGFSATWEVAFYFGIFCHHSTGTLILSEVLFDFIFGDPRDVTWLVVNT